MTIGKTLLLPELKRILFGKEKIIISEECLDEISRCFGFLENFSKDRTIYGINTGFGPMAQYRIDDSNRKDLQYNIIRSHAAGAGAILSEIHVRAALVARLMTFMQGHSGVHPDTVKLLAECINREIYPVVPEHGSVGASGDLVQLAHIGLALIGEGEVIYGGKRRPSSEVLKEENLTPMKMHIREGLAITNGTAAMTGIGAVNIFYARRLLEIAITASVLINEIASSFDDFMSESLNMMKLHSGQRKVAALMREKAAGGDMMRKREKELYRKQTDTTFSHKVQPYYSLRCVPQILGPVMDQIEYSERVLIDEINSADDNPVVDCKNKTVLHGGNFHGDYISFEMDKLKIAVTKLAMLMERQLNYLLHDRINGILPPFVNLGTIGLNYGMQGMQFTAVSTAAECQTLSNPMYVHSIPNNNDNQDIVSMGTNSALICSRIIENAFSIMAIHLTALAQAVDYLDIKNRLAPSTARIYDEIRKIIPGFKEDKPRYKAMEKIVNRLKSIDV